MGDEQLGDASNRFHVDPTPQTHFAWLRTRLSIERTMMAYLRTSVSLIGFGFTIFQFFFRFQNTPEIADVRFPNAAWYMGLALILCGTIAAVLAVLQYRSMLRYLWSADFASVAGVAKEPHKTPLLAMSVLLVLIGLFAFVSVLLRLV